MICQKCGLDNSTAIDSCSVCGHSLSPMPPPLTADHISNYAPPNTVSMPNHSERLGQADTLLATFVGEKYQSYYREKWFKNNVPTLGADRQNLNLQSINLAGFFFGLFWLCYRKMYMIAFVNIVIMTIVDLILMYVFGMEQYEKYESLGHSIFIGIWIGLIGIFGNYLYFNHSIKKIKKITATTSDLDVIQQQLVVKGGTSWGRAIGFLLFLLIVRGILYYLFKPSWLWALQ